MKWQLAAWSYLPRSLCSFPFRKDWIGGQESAFKKDKKRAPGTEGSTAFFLCYQPNCHKGFTLTTTECSFQLTQCETKFEDGELGSLQMQVCIYFFCKVSICGPLIYLQMTLLKNVCCQLLCELFCQ